MIDIAGAQFPLTFEPPAEGRQVVLLGVIPIGAVIRHGLSSYAWHLELPLKRGKLGKAHSEPQARYAIEREVKDWLEAALSVSRPAQRKAVVHG